MQSFNYSCQQIKVNITPECQSGSQLFDYTVPVFSRHNVEGNTGCDYIVRKTINNNNNNNNNHNHNNKNNSARGVSRKTLESTKELVGVRADKILLDMQKAVISSTLNIARSFKVLTAQDL